MTALDDHRPHRDVEVAAAAYAERTQPADLADILERVLDTGIVIAGEIRVDLLDIELLTIKLRLVVTSVDKAESIGLDWWRDDPWFAAGAIDRAGRGSRRATGSRPSVGTQEDSTQIGRDDVRHAQPVVDVARDDRYVVLDERGEASDS